MTKAGTEKEMQKIFSILIKFHCNEKGKLIKINEGNVVRKAQPAHENQKPKQMQTLSRTKEWLR